MDKTIGIITANYSTKYPTVLSEARPVASMPFLGRYRVVDFALSNMVNCGIRTVNCQRTIKIIITITSPMGRRTAMPYRHIRQMAAYVNLAKICSLLGFHQHQSVISNLL